jgi:hypothetical protein
MCSCIVEVLIGKLVTVTSSMMAGLYETITSSGIDPFDTAGNGHCGGKLAGAGGEHCILFPKCVNAGANDNDQQWVRLSDEVT